MNLSMSHIKSKEPEKDGEGKFWLDGNIEREKLSEVESLNNCKSSIDPCVFVCQHLNRSESTTVTENELINLDDVELSDEDTWLYTSPKDLTKEEKGLSPYKWLRKDVEDPTNQQLQMAKTALVSKLDELDILGCIQCSKLNSKNEPAFSEDAKSNCGSLMEIISEQSLEDNTDMTKLNAVSVFLPENKPKMKLDSEEKYEKRKLKDVSDVLERARLQEESLKLSSSKFFHDAARTFPRGNCSTSACAPASNLTKPASVEALYANNGKQTSVSSPVSIAQKKFYQSSPNQSPFGSTVSLTFPNDLHRSSLPNLNKGYNSLKLKKTKRTSDSHIQCPLPIYPRAEMNAPMKPELTQLSVPKYTLRSQVSMYRESQTLPSSYRTRSRNSSTNKVEPLCFSSRRRDSSPSPMCQKNNFIVNSFRRESSPCIVQQSPKKNMGMLTVHGASMPLLQNARSLSVSQLTPESDCDHLRRGSARQSFSKRQPLSSVHNCSLKQGDYSIIHNGELRKSSLPTKIPSPSNRSGIPVPSVQCAIDQSNPHEESWSHDFY